MTKKHWTNYELKPIFDSHKSFNKKAYVHVDERGNWVLESYGCMVCGYNNLNQFERYWSGYSATTMRHIKEFIYQFYKFGLGTNETEARLYASSMNKKNWENRKIY